MLRAIKRKTNKKTHTSLYGNQSHFKRRTKLQEWSSASRRHPEQNVDPMESRKLKPETDRVVGRVRKPGPLEHHPRPVTPPGQPAGRQLLHVRLDVQNSYTRSWRQERRIRGRGRVGSGLEIKMTDVKRRNELSFRMVK